MHKKQKDGHKKIVAELIITYIIKIIVSCIYISFCSNEITNKIQMLFEQDVASNVTRNQESPIISNPHICKNSHIHLFTSMYTQTNLCTFVQTHIDPPTTHTHVYPYTTEHTHKPTHNQIPTQHKRPIFMFRLVRLPNCKLYLALFRNYCEVITEQIS